MELYHLHRRVATQGYTQALFVCLWVGRTKCRRRIQQGVGGTFEFDRLLIPNRVILENPFRGRLDFHERQWSLVFGRFGLQVTCTDQP